MRKPSRDSSKIYARFTIYNVKDEYITCDNINAWQGILDKNGIKKCHYKRQIGAKYFDIGDCEKSINQALDSIKSLLIKMFDEE